MRKFMIAACVAVVFTVSGFATQVAMADHGYYGGYGGPGCPTGYNAGYGGYAAGYGGYGGYAAGYGGYQTPYVPVNPYMYQQNGYGSYPFGTAGFGYAANPFTARFYGAAANNYGYRNTTLPRVQLRIGF